LSFLKPLLLNKKHCKICPKGGSYNPHVNSHVPLERHGNEIINPVGVQGVFGCKECGGSGYKTKGSKPHPCNECAKKNADPNYKIKLSNKSKHTIPVITAPLNQINAPLYTYGSNPQFSGIPGCTRCSGLGYVTSKRTHLQKGCKDCTLKSKTYVLNEPVISTNTFGISSPISNFSGVPGCTKCGGSGFLMSSKKGKSKACKDCINITGNCPKCNNTGFVLGKNNKRCKCKHAH